MFRFSKFVAVATMIAGSATAVSAQAVTSPTKPFSLGFSGGASVPLSDLGKIVNTGYSVNGHLGIAALVLPISLRGDVGYNRWGGQSGGALHILSFTGNAVYSVPGVIVAHPYLIGGIGAYKAGASSGDVSYNDRTRFGFNVGGGITIPLSGFNTFIEARYNQINGMGGSAKFVPITVGVMF